MHHHHRLTLAVLASLALSACAAGDPDAPGAGFDPDRVLAVEIEVAPADWEALRRQTRSWVDLHASCLRAPLPSPYTYVPATVTIDGARVARVGLRKRGFLGSLSEDKPSLRVALDEYVPGQHLGGTVDLLLNNALQDPSYVRQCLAYRTFAAAGLPAPRCAFARVRVNGEDLGVYVHVERIDEAFVARHFADADGDLYEGTYSDFRAGWTATFELEHGAGDRRALDAVVAALERPDGELVDALGEVVDLDALLRFWAVEILVTHRDGYAGNANNYFVYRDPRDDRFRWIPWGADGTFRAGDDPFGNGRVAVAASSFAPWRLYQVPAARARLDATLRALLDEVWDEDALLAEIDRAEALLAPHLDAGALAPHLDEVRAVVRGRRAAVLEELDGAPASTPALDDPPCLPPRGEVRGAIATRWGTGDGDAFATGTGTFAGALDGAALDVVDVGATAGADPADADRARIVVAAAVAGGSVQTVVLELERARLVAGARLAIDAVAVAGTLYEVTPATGAYRRTGIVTDGTIDVAEVGTTDGAPVRISFDLAVAAPP